jgi:lysophospholipase L1-like esterase
MIRTFAFAAVALFALETVATSASGAPIVVSLGDSIAYGFGVPSRATQSYAALYAASIGGTLVNLGERGTICQDVIDHQVARLPSSAAIVILNCGTNDVGGFDFAPPDNVTPAAAASPAELEASQKSFTRLVKLLRAKAPGATIYLVNLRHWQRIRGPEPTQVARNVDVWNAMLAATGLRVIDLAGDVRMYDPANFLSDEIHPNVAGNKIIAGKLEATPARPASLRPGSKSGL